MVSIEVQHHRSVSRQNTDRYIPGISHSNKKERKITKNKHHHS